MAGELVVSTINGAGFDGGNVVYNPEFTINQRGAASRTATSSAYNFDRWYYDGTNLLQGIEGNNLRAGTYVISWEGSSTAAFSLNTAAAGSQGGQSYTSVTNGGTITIASVGSNNLWIRFTSDLTNLTKVKVSPGTEASGFVARPYGTELALCERYFEVIRASADFSAFGIGYAETTTDWKAYILYSTKRATPTITFSGAIGTFYPAIGHRSLTMIPNDPLLTGSELFAVTTGLTPGYASRFSAIFNSATRILISSEL